MRAKQELSSETAAGLLSLARDALGTFTRWFSDHVDPLARASYPLERAAWQKELDLITDLMDRPERIRIAFVGTTGAGKSTFLNAVLGQEVLPVGVMQPCTSFVTSVRHSSDHCQVSVRFSSREEWDRDLENLIAAFSPGETDEPPEGRAESRRLMEAARKRIQAVYETTLTEKTDAASLRKLTLPTAARDIFDAGSVATNDFADAKEMLAYLRKLIRGESSLWPLVKEVSVAGPYPCLTGGLELVDLPGLNDPNEARVEVTREYLRTSPFVWVIFSMVRGLTEDIQRILRDEKLLRTLVLSGTYGALSLVGTKADDIDTNNAPQLGLEEDCSIPDLITAYREQTVTQVREQLEQMVRDLASPDHHDPTLQRMIALAREVRVHATSASAYIKLKGIAPLRKSYGLDTADDTGIPLVHQHLAEISAAAAGDFNAQSALKRLEQLRDEIAFFFRGKAQPPTAELEEARGRFHREREELSQRIRDAHTRASDQLKLKREQFLEKIDPLFRASVQGVNRATVGWTGIHWATLRAIVRSNGVFKSPSTGRSFDLNGDLAEPLLDQLPVTWEKYFTDDLTRTTEEFSVRVTECCKSFCDKITLIVELMFHKGVKGVSDQLRWFQDKVALLSNSSMTRVVALVRERRAELAAKMPEVARGCMQPAYDASKQEAGTGMKQRILQHIQSQATASARPIFSTIHSDLLEGLTDLEVLIAGMLSDLAKAAEEQARSVSHNANLDVDEATIDPVIAGLLNALPSVQ
ncbi:dynamin family protein [Candidatus Binatia bacterium]|nr:dynamin family protein [Candidatus Binatia bacterium]